MLEQQYRELIELMDEIYEYLTGNKWRENSEVRLNILLTTRLDGLKHLLSDFAYDELLSSEKMAYFLETLIDRINNILFNLPKERFPLQYYDLELFRLRLASIYAMAWGNAGELQITGAAHALANVLIGIKSLTEKEIKYLIVDWDHPEHYKRRRLLLNFVSSAYLFFFSLCSSLNLIYKHDLEEWLSEGFRFAEYLLKYSDYFWNVPKTVEILKRSPQYGTGPNFSPFYATFANINYFISFLLDLQKFFFNPEIKIQNYERITNVYDVEEFFNGLYKILKKLDYYIADLKKHVNNGIFPLNENPFDDPTVKETIREVKLTKSIVKGLHAVYRIVTKEITSEIGIIEKDVLPSLFKDLKTEYSKYFSQEQFLESQMGEVVASYIEEMLFFAGIIALKKQNYVPLNEVEEIGKMFLAEKGIQRYPNLAGFYYTLKATLDIERGEYNNLLRYAKELEKISRYSIYHPRDAFSFGLLSLMLKLVSEEIDIDTFINNILSLHELHYSSLSPALNEEIEIYIKNLQIALIGKIMPAYNLKRLLMPLHYDKYSIFIPDLRKVNPAKGYDNIIYLPFNLAKDCVVFEKPVIAEVQNP